PDLKKLEIAVMARAGVPMAPGDVAGPGGSFQPPQPPMEQRKLANTLRIQAQKDYNAKNLDDGVKALNEAAALEQNSELMKTRDEIQRERLNDRNKINFVAGIDDGPSVTYNLGPKLSVPSRNDEQVVEIAKLKLAPKFYYKAVPVLSRSVYRLADLVNKSELVFLPGEATMFQGTDFVGRMRMPLVCMGEE